MSSAKMHGRIDFFGLVIIIERVFHLIAVKIGFRRLMDFNFFN